MEFLKIAFISIIISQIVHNAASSVIEYEKLMKCENFEEEKRDPYNNFSRIVDDSDEIAADGASIVECAIDEYCFALWSNTSFNGILFVKKGCFKSDDSNCGGQNRCVANRKNRNLYFCCCDGELCNSDVFFEPEEVIVYEDTFDTNHIRIIPYVFLSVVVLLIAVIFFYRKRILCKVETGMVVSTRSRNDFFEDQLPVNLIELKGHGRFGEVWKALNLATNELVAVKISPSSDEKSWLTEQEVFKLPHMDQENILKFIAAEKHSDGLQTKYWLITAYHERGSLYDYLKNHTVTWDELCLISCSMARGLAHLHEEISFVSPEIEKPSIAHRDFKSKNVLLKADLSACIADFGLALVFKHSQSYSGNQHQVGTRRYMAPEVLEGSISFLATSFQRIDVYACGLVLWEILSRCTLHEEATAKYQLPFEKELGDRPTMDEMIDWVVRKNQRPVIKDTWKNHPLLSSVCETIEECWEHEPGYRISASCVAERFNTNLDSPSSTKCETRLLQDIV